MASVKWWFHCCMCANTFERKCMPKDKSITTEVSKVLTVVLQRVLTTMIWMPKSPKTWLKMKRLLCSVALALVRLPRFKSGLGNPRNSKWVHVIFFFYYLRTLAPKCPYLFCHCLNHRIHEHTHTAEGTHEGFY